MTEQPVTQADRDISHWADWSDIELIEQAACGCQFRKLVDDEIIRDSIAMNIIAPLRQAIAKARLTAINDTLERAEAALVAAFPEGQVWSEGIEAIRNLKESNHD